MIRRSSNPDATALMKKVGLDYIARTLISSRYRLYDPFRNGGLWAGKEYAAVGAWRHAKGVFSGLGWRQGVFPDDLLLIAE